MFHRDLKALRRDTAPMYDLATRILPAAASASGAADLIAVPFDWRLGEPLPITVYPFPDFTTQPPSRGFAPLATYCLELEDTLQTAIIISLFTDRRAGVDDVLPANQGERRGWVGDEFMGNDFDARPDPWGSHLWLDYSGKTSREVLEHARYAAEEALAWLVRDGIASRVSATAQWVGERQDRLAVRPTIYQAGRASPVYDVLWGTSLRRAAQGALQ
jgi:phage gp46-like protein